VVFQGRTWCCGDDEESGINGIGRREIRAIIRTEVYDMAKSGTVVGSIVVTVGIVLVVAMLPDIVRYMKIRAM
jgi:hypothetical protein